MTSGVLISEYESNHFSLGYYFRTQEVLNICISIKPTLLFYLSDIFFEFDQGGRRGHSRKLFKRRSRLDVRKHVFSNRMLISGTPCLISDHCINTNTVNSFKSHISKHLEPETGKL